MPDFINLPQYTFLGACTVDITVYYDNASDPHIVHVHMGAG